MKHLRTLSFLLISLFFAACDCCIYDNLKNCPQGIAFRFASETPCGDVLKLDELKQLHVQVYNSKGRFVQQYDEKDITVTSDYVLSIPFYAPGDSYHFVFWGMQNDKAYILSQNQLELNLKFRAENNTVTTTHLPALFYGAIHGHKIIDRRDLGTQIDTLAVNMLPYSYPLTLNVQGLEPNKKYTVEISDNNIRFDWNGRVLDKPVTYMCQASNVGDMKTVTLDVMRLVRPSNAVVRIKEQATGKVVYTMPMEKILQEMERLHHVSIHPDCLKSLRIDLKVKLEPDGTYAGVSVRINQWNLVFREVIL